ncbi:MAG: 4Fe-4S binding protein [Proteobacteria bacterium]|nr:4Fe-4S binding protein [Pseudomonadota bacterium]
MQENLIDYGEANMRPFIEKELCGNCGLCVKVCRYDVFVENEGEIVVLTPEGCIECACCADECPNQAISIRE